MNAQINATVNNNQTANANVNVNNNNNIKKRKRTPKAEKTPVTRCQHSMCKLARTPVEGTDGEYTTTARWEVCGTRCNGGRTVCAKHLTKSLTTAMACFSTGSRSEYHDIGQRDEDHLEDGYFLFTQMLSGSRLRFAETIRNHHSNPGRLEITLFVRARNGLPYMSYRVLGFSLQPADGGLFRVRLDVDVASARLATGPGTKHQKNALARWKPALYDNDAFRDRDDGKGAQPGIWFYPPSEPKVRRARAGPAAPLALLPPAAPGVPELVTRMVNNLVQDALAHTSPWTAAPLLLTWVPPVPANPMPLRLTDIPVNCLWPEEMMDDSC